MVDGINRFLKANNYSNIVNSVYCFALIKSNNELYNNIKNKLELTALQSLAQLVQNKNFRATELMLINTSNMFKNSANTTNLKLQINTSEVNFENMSIEELNEYEKRLLNITDVRENLVDTAYKRHKHIILEDELDEVYNKLNILNKIDDIELV